MKRIRWEFFSGGIFLSLLIYCNWVGAQTPPASETAGGIIRQEIQTEKQKGLESRIESPRTKDAQISPEDVLSQEAGPKVMISKIIIEGNVLLPANVINKLIQPYQGRELSLREMQKVADLITEEYRKRGYITSRAYLPPQNVGGGTLVIKIVEGKLGKIEIQGNRYFKSSLLKKKMGMQPEGYFDYSALQRALVYINESPDRAAKALLVPGAEPGTTDIILEVEDHYPFHVGFEYDNWGSRFIDKNRFALVLEHNNITGNDDKIYLKGQASEAERLLLQQARYIYPVTAQLDVGTYLLFSRTRLGEEFKDLDSNGKAAIYGIFLNKTLVENNNIAVRMNLGFDSKSIRNDLLGVQISHDELRIFKAGFDLDVGDRWGRTILTAQADTGVEDFLGAMAAKDPEASRAGAGGRFLKGAFNLFRLQPMPLESALLWKNSMQFTNYNLVASEQFQIGGPTSVRGYPPAEYSGDKGYYGAVEWSFPVYPLSRNVRVPFSEERLYDALRLVVFYDWGFVNTKSIGAGEKENHTIHGVGFGARFNVNDDLDCRVEIGYPLDETPSDGDHAHTWVEMNLKF